MQYIDIETWERKEHFKFFKQFDEPYYGVCIDVDCTALYRLAKENNQSFYLTYLHRTLTAVNDTLPFKYRITDDGRVAIFDTIGVGPTIARENNLYGFGQMEYYADFDHFAEEAQKEIDRVKGMTGLCFPAEPRMNIIHFSALPWIKFTGLSHARAFKFHDSVPKISVGKVFPAGDKLMMPVSIHVHHALVDGYDVGMFIKRLEELFLNI